MRMPTRAPATAPTAPPAIASARATASGPPTSNTPKPGIARLAKPAKVPSNPPPDAAPIDRSRNLSEPLRGGSSAGSVLGSWSAAATEIAVSENPAARSCASRSFRRSRVLSEPIASRELSLIITHSLQDPYRDLTQSKGQRSSGFVVRKNKESDFDLTLGGADGSDIAQ